MNEIYILWRHLLPALDKHSPLLSFFSPSYGFYPLSFLPLTVKGITWVKCWWWHLWNRCLPPTFPILHPLHWLSVLSVRAHTHPQIPLSPPYVAWRAVLMYRSSASLRWREMERDDGRKRKLLRLNRKKKQLGSMKEGLLLSLTSDELFLGNVVKFHI